MNHRRTSDTEWEVFQGAYQDTYMCDIPWYSRGIPLFGVSMHFSATVDVVWLDCHGDLVLHVRGGAGRALYEDRLLSRSLCGDFSELRCKSLVLWMRIYNKPKSS